jgi:chorismate mutase/prephenate dehydratase
MNDEYRDALDTLRMQISMIDTDLLRLLEERVATAKEIGKIKAHYGMPIYVPEVEKQKIEKLSAFCKYSGLVETIWPVIMCYTRSVE